MPANNGPIILPVVLFTTSNDMPLTSRLSPTMSRIPVRRQGSSNDLATPVVKASKNACQGCINCKMISVNRMAADAILMVSDIISIRWRLSRSAINPVNNEKKGQGRCVEYQHQAQLKRGIGDLEDQPAEDQQFHPSGHLGQSADAPQRAKIGVLQNGKDGRPTFQLGLHQATPPDEVEPM